MNNEFQYEVNPNPFDEKFELSLSLPEAGQVSVMFYDPAGHRLNYRCRKYLEKGKHTLAMDRLITDQGTYLIEVLFSNHLRQHRITKNIIRN